MDRPINKRRGPTDKERRSQDRPRTPKQLMQFYKFMDVNPSRVAERNGQQWVNLTTTEVFKRVKDVQLKSALPFPSNQYVDMKDEHKLFDVVSACIYLVTTDDLRYIGSYYI